MAVDAGSGERRWQAGFVNKALLSPRGAERHREYDTTARGVDLGIWRDSADPRPATAGPDLFADIGKTRDPFPWESRRGDFNATATIPRANGPDRELSTR